MLENGQKYYFTFGIIQYGVAGELSFLKRQGQLDRLQPFVLKRR